MKKRSKKKAQIRNRFLILILIIFIILTIISINKKEEQEETFAELKFQTQIFENVANQTADVSKYIVYGTHLNLEGSLNVSNSEIDRVKLIMKNSNNEDIDIDTDYSIVSSQTEEELQKYIIEFSTGDTINKGIDLEDLDTYSYYLLLKVTYSNGQEKYYSLSNKTEYGNIEYYTITKNNTNNKVYINFNTYESISYMNFNVSKVNSLPDDVYDVVIDPGHGGMDVGATSQGYYESNIVLNSAKELKAKLENLGLKVFLTRDGTESDDENTAYNMYDENGRITVAMESHAKIFISLHLNSNEEYLTTGGVEIYCSSNMDLTFAKALADNIVTTANTNYSYLETYKQLDGVYIQNFSENDILIAKQAAIDAGYTPYENITTSTSYLFMLRETGGIATGAYVDGRNTVYSANKYYNSNVGIESYLVELGYMNISDDLYNIINNSSLYMDGIAQSIENFYLK